MLLLATMAVPATADHNPDPDDGGPFVAAKSVDGNPTCRDLGDWDYEFKIDQELGIGTYEFSDPDSEFEVEVVVTDTDRGHVMAFDANTSVEGVFVKGGPNGNLYDYSDLGFSVSADSNLHAPEWPVGSGTYSGISHVSFCFDEEPTVLTGEIGVVKTAEGDFDREITWELEKSVDPESHSGAAGEDAGSSNWTVVATKNETLDNYQVTGEIELSTLGSDLDAQVEKITDSLGDLTDLACELGGESFDVFTEPISPNSTVVCTYTVAVDDDEADENTVTVTGSFVEGEAFEISDTADIAWTESVIGDEDVTLTDGRFEYQETINDTTTAVFPETFPCPSDPAEYTNGVHERTEENTATLVGSNTDIERNAAVDITCVLDALDVEKTAEASYDRTVDWELEKSVDPDSHSGTAGDTFTSDWTVTATKSETLDNYQVTGEIIVTNDTAIDRDFTVTDELNDGTEATVTCPTTTVPANDSVTCTYEAFPEDDSATMNTATVSMDGNEDQIATAEVSFEENLIGDDEVLLEDDRSEHSEMISETTVLEYSEPFECPTDEEAYEDGQYSETFLNTATLDGPNTDEEASASVTVDCALVFVGETATGAGLDWSETNGAPSTWFQYTPWADIAAGGADIITGQNHEVIGTVTGERTSTTTLHFELDDPWELDAADSGNVKIQPMSCDSDQPYVSPGQFDYHVTLEGSSFTVEGLDNAECYGIHLDVGYWDVG